MCPLFSRGSYTQSIAYRQSMQTVGMYFPLTMVISGLPQWPTQTEFLAFQSIWLVYTT